MRKKIEHERLEKPIITPEEFLNCEVVDLSRYKFEKALLRNSGVSRLLSQTHKQGYS